MAGYSSTPLAKKLGIKPGHTLLLIDAPQGWAVPELPGGVVEQRLVAGTGFDEAARPAGSGGVEGAAQRGAIGQADIVLAFCRSAGVVGDVGLSLPSTLRPDAAAWVVWPRKAGGHVSDVTENLIRDVLLPSGLVDTKVAALDADWSGLRFVWRKALRPT